MSVQDMARASEQTQRPAEDGDAALKLLMSLATQPAPLPPGSRAVPARSIRTRSHRRRVGARREGAVVVLVPAHNEAASIDATVQSLRGQTRPPDRIIVISDNCSDDTDDLSMLYGAEVMVTVRNSARKAGALNQALARILPSLGEDDFVLIVDADSQLASDWIRCATEALMHDRRVGGVSGTYTGERRPGLLLQLQRNEFVRASRLVRRRADLWVLSGTGTLFTVPVLRQVAAERGRALPGIHGEYYCSSSITEDYEITLALKTLGYRCLCPPGCTATTELMPTWRHLFRQRLRWQSGTLTALRQYGITRATWTNWARQAFFYGRYCSQLACWAILISSLVTHPGLSMPPWVLAMLLVIYLERVITVRRAGPKGVLLALLLVPEWGYGMFDGLYLFQALRHEITQRDVSWGHVVKDGAGHGARNSYQLPAPRRPVFVREAGHG
jgi:cellulose synthase/poly-beta-1,6-N-acetylglucosamine synthase-like glycosyltransferase